MRGPAALLIASLSFVPGFGCTRSQPDGAYVPRPPGTLTFSRDIAPVIFESCSNCHRPGEAAPFSLLTYEDVRSRAKQIADVTARRYMPPWHARPGHGEFVGARFLTEDAIGIIRQWVEEGTREGDPAHLPPLPAWKEGWQLGTPDLVLELPEPFQVPADGPDIYRNFVFRTRLERRAYVRALEVNPDNRRVAHHALLVLDLTPKSRRLDEGSPGPGFGGEDGMKLPESAAAPGGFFHSWNPGRMPDPGRDDLAWPLDPTTDVVLQMHLQPSGKAESVKPSIGLYFARALPKRFPVVIGLRSLLIDIPAGEKSYSFETHYTLPVDVDALGLLPHAHYICKQIQGYATLPDGKKEWLLDIEDWDFNWQSEYRFARPVFLPKGTRITQRFVYDNSADNPRNPRVPPVRVRYGLQSTDEMGELWIQVLARKAEDTPALESHYQLWQVENENLRRALSILAESPNDWKMHLEVAKVRFLQGRKPEGLAAIERAIQAAPLEAEPHRLLAFVKTEERTPESLRTALDHLTLAIRIRPDYFEAFNDLGLLWQMTGDYDRAARCYERARELEPGDPVAVYNLGRLACERGNISEGAQLFRQALAIDPSYSLAGEALRKILGR